MYSDILNIHTISQVYIDSPLFQRITAHAKKNVFIIFVKPEELITA